MPLKFLENPQWHNIHEIKIGFIERNQDFRGLSIYHELRYFSKTYFSG